MRRETHSFSMFSVELNPPGVKEDTTPFAHIYLYAHTDGNRRWYNQSVKIIRPGHVNHAVWPWVIKPGLNWERGE